MRLRSWEQGCSGTRPATPICLPHLVVVPTCRPPEALPMAAQPAFPMAATRRSRRARRPPAGAGAALRSGAASMVLVASRTRAAETLVRGQALEQAPTPGRALAPERVATPEPGRVLAPERVATPEPVMARALEQSPGLE